MLKQEAALPMVFRKNGFYLGFARTGETQVIMSVCPPGATPTPGGIPVVSPDGKTWVIGRGSVRKKQVYMHVFHASVPRRHVR